MSEAAVTERVRAAADGFKDAAPGHVFQLYLPMWRQDWSLDKNAKSEAARRATHIPKGVRDLGEALRDRQQALASARGALTRKAVSTSPFATGLGNEHPIENGFAFLTPYGLPYLAGSGIKGVLRRAMQELGKEGHADFDDATITALVGVEKVDKPEDARRGALDVWDCYPLVAGDKLVVEIMTPHYSGYYQKGETPHDAGQPNPVPFLAVPAGSWFDFHVVCHEGRLPVHLRGARWQVLLNAALDHAFDWLGFGAKTSVGYGAMAEDPAEKLRRAQAQAAADAAAARQAEAQRLAQMSPADREWDQAQPVLAAFSAALDKAKAAGAFNPSGPFNQLRLDFVKTTLAWTDPRSRAAAGDLLARGATKEWGRPSKKERWQELQQAIAALRGEA
jgi:CRISPR-associated protein Cmr6